MKQTKDWAAWINRQPGPGATPTLHVTGEFEFSTGGYSVSLSKSAEQVEENALVLEFTVDRPGDDGVTTQAIETKEVHYEEESDSNIEHVTIIQRHHVDVEVVQ